MQHQHCGKWVLHDEIVNGFEVCGHMLFGNVFATKVINKKVG